MIYKGCCVICEKPFSRKCSPPIIPKYCSRICTHKGTQKGKYKNCDACQKQFWQFKYQSENKNKFCSRKCSLSFQKGENHPRWKGGFCEDGHGYKTIRIKGRYVYEHRYLMEKKLGRKLSSKEHVHHINENIKDNSIENLVVLSCSEHNKIHHPKLGRWSKNFECCKICNGTSSKHSGKGFCQNCYIRRLSAKSKAQVLCKAHLYRQCKVCLEAGGKLLPASEIT